MSRARRALGLLVLLAAAAGAVALALRARTPAPRRVIVVGLDGADWQLLDAYVAKGAMPELGRLSREGRTGILHSLVPPLSPLVWTTIATGRSPLEHRILDFTRFHPTTGQREPITSDERRVKAVWEMAGDSGRDVAVFGLWATHPAEAVKGLMVSDRLFSFQRQESRAPAGAVHPPAEEVRILSERAAVEAEVSHAALQAYLPWLTAAEYETLAARPDPHAHPVTALRRILIETRLYHRLALERLRRSPPALTFVYFQGTDSVGHVFAPYAPPRLPAIPEEEFARYSGVPEAYFREVDGLLGEYRRIAETAGATLLVVSDHGFLWSEGRPSKPDSLAKATAGLWHRQEGISLLWGAGITPGAARGEGRVDQVTSTILALLGLAKGQGLGAPALAGVPEVEPAKDYGPRAAVRAAAADPAAAEALEKLKALGYLGATESAARPAGAETTRTAGSYNNEGLLLIEGGRLEEAKAAFEQALRVDAHAASAAQNLSGLLAESDPARADALLVGALKDGLGDGPHLVAAAARAHRKRGDAARARRLLDGAIAVAPADPELHVERGSVRIEARDCAGALQDFESARRAAPQLALAHGLAGTAMLCLGREREARAAFEQSLVLDPTQTRLREALTRLR